ncbi:MAG: methyltransferase, partial [Pseudonocardia sp.]|nr:methyltransferase [Pseudonocardia sp.]
FVAAGNGPSRLRLINGMGLEVLTRLTDGGYDLVFVDAAPADQPHYLGESLRLLRTGGIIAINGVTPDGADAAGQAAEAAQEVAKQVREDDRLAPVLLPLGDGLLAAVKRA